MYVCYEWGSNNGLDEDALDLSLVDCHLNNYNVCHFKVSISMRILGLVFFCCC